MPELQANLFDYNQAQLAAWLTEHGEPAYRSTQIIHWLHHEGVTDINSMNNLSKRLRNTMLAHFNTELPQITRTQVANDGCIKWLIRLHDGNSVEVVYIPEIKVIRDLERARATLCISSQAGCTLDCKFCATGKQGFNRNLSAGEIISQLWIARAQLRANFPQSPSVSNVVFMGMGEPLLNYQPVVSAAQLMLDDMAYGLSRQRVTISTSGIIPAMLKLKQDVDVALAVSLHAPNDELRNQIMPINKKYSLPQLMDVCRNYFNTKPNASASSRKRKVMMEYVMLDGVNDQPQHAKQLIKLLSNVPCKINLIPFNPFPGTDYQASPPEIVSQFQQRLINAGFNARIRRTRAQNVDAACGQLAGQIQDRTGRHQKWQRQRHNPAQQPAPQSKTHETA